MSKTKLTLLILGIVLLFMGATAVSIFNMETYPRNWMNTSKLPEGFKNFQAIDTNSTLYFGNYEMKLILEDYEPLEHFINSKNELIVVKGRIEKTYYKLNRDGDVMDSLKLIMKDNTTGHEQLFGEYIINSKKEYYKTWLIDGDKAEKPMLILNKDRTWSDEQQEALIDDIAYRYIYYDYNYNYQDGGDFAYFNDNEWYLLYTNIKKSWRSNNYDSSRGKHNIERVLFEDYSSTINPIYFQREEFEIKDNYQGGGTSSFWNGTLYSELMVDKGILKFKMPIRFKEGFMEDKLFKTYKDDIRKLKEHLFEIKKPYVYYTHKNFNFSLFSYNDNFNCHDCTGRKLYRIKKLQTP